MGCGQSKQVLPEARASAKYLDKRTEPSPLPVRAACPALATRREDGPEMTRRALTPRSLARAAA